MINLCRLVEPIDYHDTVTNYLNRGMKMKNIINERFKVISAASTNKNNEITLTLLLKDLGANRDLPDFIMWQDTLFEKYHETYFGLENGKIVNSEYADLKNFYVYGVYQKRSKTISFAQLSFSNEDSATHNYDLTFLVNVVKED